LGAPAHVREHHELAVLEVPVNRVLGPLRVAPPQGIEDLPMLPY